MTRWWLAAALATTVPAAWAAEPSVATYTATYSVAYKGREAGTAEFSVRQIEEQADVYEFTSRVLAKGLLKLARPNPAVERSRFRVEQSGIRPLEFWYEDGSRSGEDNFHVAFDWERRVATVSTESGRRELALPAMALDRGSLQVALMRDLALNGVPSTYSLADEDSVAEYAYTDNGSATIATGIGSVEARRLIQQRAGSSRTTELWMAPTLGFLPVRIEQRRDGEVQTAFELLRVDGVTAAP